MVGSIWYKTANHLHEKVGRNLKSKLKILTYHGYYAASRRIHMIPDRGPWNVLFFGTDDFATESLRSLYNKYRSNALQRLEVVTVKTKTENAVTQYAKKHGIVVHVWPIQFQIKDFHIGVIVSFGHLIPLRIINSFPLGMINVHGSLLPKWRGAAPIIHSLMNGDQQTGITIMKIKPKKFDIGEIVAQKEVNIDSHETMPELRTKLAKLGADLLTETLDGLPQTLHCVKPQNDADATYAPKVQPAISLIKWSEMSAKNIYDLQRALFGLYPLTTTFHENVQIKLLGIEQIQTPSVSNEISHELPGTVVFNKKNKTLCVKCAQGSWVSVKSVIIPGRAPMSASDFNNGFLAGRNKRKISFY